MIEICTHVWAEAMPHYASLLCYHLHSALRHPPAVPVVFHICYHHPDELTRNVINEYAQLNSDKFRVVGLPLPLDLLGRRHYGRDVVAAGSKADLVWMADVDYVYGEGCLDAAHREWLLADDPIPVVYYPEVVNISRDHETGDKQIARVSGTKAPPIDPTEFVPLKQTKAIGGTFIMDGDYARSRGYLRGGKWRPPWKDQIPPFASTRCDVCFKQRACRHGEFRAVPLPNLYRIRHSTSTVNNKEYRLASQFTD